MVPVQFSPPDFTPVLAQQAPASEARAWQVIDDEFPWLPARTMPAAAPPPLLRLFPARAT